MYTIVARQHVHVVMLKAHTLRTRNNKRDKESQSKKSSLLLKVFACLWSKREVVEMYTLTNMSLWIIWGKEGERERETQVTIMGHLYYYHYVLKIRHVLIT